jgi:sodium-dependent phosphate transporter
MSNFTSCATGVYDCNYEGIPTSELDSCADYNREYVDMESNEWIVIVAALIMCLMAFGIGSNDAANSWATSVGSGAITLKTALILGSVCEFLGTVLLGSGVAKTIKEDISDIENRDCW